MPTGGDYRLDDAFIEELFLRQYYGLFRYAQSVFIEHGNVDPAGRAEDVLQETFYLAFEKRDELMASHNPAKWLKSAATYKIREALRTDRKWVKGLMLLPSEEPLAPFPELEELSEFIPKEDYVLLKRLYIEGYTYKELCGELNVSKSNLGMRINRIKKAFKKKYGKIFR